jgi:hypothetical protein
MCCKLVRAPFHWFSEQKMDNILLFFVIVLLGIAQ